MLGHHRRWVIPAALTILAMVCALAAAAHARHHGAPGGWDLAAGFLVVAVGCLTFAVRSYRSDG